MHRLPTVAASQHTAVGALSLRRRGTTSRSTGTRRSSVGTHRRNPRRPLDTVLRTIAAEPVPQVTSVKVGLRLSFIQSIYSLNMSQEAETQAPQLSKESDRAVRVLNKYYHNIQTNFNIINEEFLSDDVDADVCLGLINKVLDLIDEFARLERDNFDETAPQTFSRNVGLLKTAIRLKIKAQKLKSNQPENTVNNIQPAAQIKLPEITLPSFSGDYREWYSFIDRFNSLIGYNAQLSNLQKFQYLKSSLTGEAARTVQSLEITELNYSIALQLLRDNFENKRLIINGHIQALFNMPYIKKESSQEYRDLINVITQNTRALQALDRPVNKSEDWLINLILMHCSYSLQVEWENQLKVTQIPTLEELEKFLAKRCQVLESVTKPENSVTFKQPCPTMNQASCAVCSQQHKIFNCHKFRAMDVHKRSDVVRSKRLCRNCLKSGHNLIECRSLKLCKICNQKHNSLLHFTNNNSSQGSSSNNSSLHLKNVNNDQVLLSTCIVEVQTENAKQNLRALLDSGSQMNLITNKTANRLNLKQFKTKQSFSGVGGNNNCLVQSYVNITINSLASKFNSNINCYVVDKITNQLPAQLLNIHEIKIPDGIILADPNFYQPDDIDLLIGAELFFDLLSPERLKNNKLTFQNSKLGWIISGKAPSKRPTTNLVCNSITFSQLNNSIERFWKIEQVDNNEQIKSKEDILCEDIFAKTVERDSENRFVVALPWKTNPSTLGNSYGIAKKRLINLENKLKSNPNLKLAYHSFINEYIALGHMTKGSFNQNGCGYYLPHHAVIKKSSLTTKLRVVFDASAKSNNNLSLNDILLTGPSLQDELFDILIRFRTHEYVVTADIQMMFRQIKIREVDRKYQRILWRESPNLPIQVYELNTVTYGTCCAPFLAVQCLQTLANEAPDNFTRDTILRDFYMDDVLTGAPTIQEARQLRDALCATLAKGGFILRKWASNSINIIEDLDNSEITKNKLILSPDEQIKTLGVQWNPNKDSIEYKSFSFGSSCITKRSILSEISKYFDPLGLLGPVIIKAKLIMQEIWKLGLKWDERLPQKIIDSWVRLRDELSAMKPISTERKVKMSPNDSIEIHAFGDASLIAYGSAVYIKSINSHSTCLKLFCAKSRVAPLKTVTLPRLELCAALLTANLVERVKKALHNKDIKCFYYTDSTIVLSWLNAEPFQFKQFVAHRIGEIQRLSNISNWYHIRSEHNPADIISRGALPSELINNALWWYGPGFLKQGPEPQTFIPTFNEQAEFRVMLATQANSQIIPWLHKYSSFTKLIRITSWINRFIYNSQHSNNKITGELNVDEINKSEILIIKSIQSTSFYKEIIQINSNQKVDNIMQLSPFIDPSGIIRVGGRLNYLKLAYDTKFPIILPKNNFVTKLIVRHYHNKHLHIGPQGTLAAIRTKFWPISGKNTVKQIIRECNICFKANPQNSIPIMGNLPKYRAEQVRPFIKTGIDYGGPFMIKEGVRKSARLIKKYIALFVCMATKAVHIEVVNDLTTESFLAALRRFISRRGLVTDLYSDNATNFVGANNELKKLYAFLQDEQDQLKSGLSIDRIQWHFIPPKAPHFGGLWEAGIKSTKRILYKMMGGASLRDEEFVTLLIEIESILNSRPLCPLSNDPNDLSFLTPGHFLIGGNLRALPEPNLEEVKIGRLSRWQLVQRMQQQFWARWKKEYLQELQNRRKWKSSTGAALEVGQLVLIQEDNIPPNRWKTGRVQILHPGSDGVVRAVTVKTNGESFVRPTVKLYALPFRQD